MSNGIAGLWESIRGRADDPSLGYVGASMLPGVGEATDLVEIGAGLQDRDLGRIGLGITALALPFVGAAGLKTALKKLSPNKRLKELRKMRKSGLVTYSSGQGPFKGSGKSYERPKLISPAIRGKGNEVWIPHPEAIERGYYVIDPFDPGETKHALTHGSIVSKGRGKVYDDIPDVVRKNISSEQVAPRRTSPNVGYIDETGQFLNRKDAHHRAVVTGQIKDTGVDLESIDLKYLHGRHGGMSRLPKWPPHGDPSLPIFENMQSARRGPPGSPEGWGMGGWAKKTPDDIQELRDILEDLPNEPSLRWSNRRPTSRDIEGEGLEAVRRETERQAKRARHHYPGEAGSTLPAPLVVDFELSGSTRRGTPIYEQARPKAKFGHGEDILDALDRAKKGRAFGGIVGL